jgi:putative aminopeptidase FrvX
MAAATPSVLRELLAAAGPSGYESAPAAVWRDAAASFADVSSDAMGSSVARVPGQTEGLRLVVIGHIDEIGLIVSHIDDDGYLWFSNVGGWDPQILVGQRVRLLTRAGSVPGVVGRKAIHLLREEERKRVPELRDLHIDLGASGGE